MSSGPLRFSHFFQSKAEITTPLRRDHRGVNLCSEKLLAKDASHHNFSCLKGYPESLSSECRHLCVHVFFGLINMLIKPLPVWIVLGANLLEHNKSLISIKLALLKTYISELSLKSRN